MDDYKNYAYSTLAAGISAAATSCSVASGTGSRFPSTAFDAVIWDASYPSATAAVLAGAGEQVRVGVRSTDTFPLTRAQGGTSAVALNTTSRTYAIAQVLTESAFEAMAPKADAALTGTTSIQVLSPDIADLGTVASGTVTLSSTKAVNKVILSGSAATIALPSSPPDGYRSLVASVTGNVALTVTTPSLLRLDDPALGTVTAVSVAAASAGKVIFSFLALGGSYVGMAVIGDDSSIPSSKLAGLSTDGTNASPSNSTWLSSQAYATHLAATLDALTLPYADVTGLTQSAFLTRGASGTGAAELGTFGAGLSFNTSTRVLTATATGSSTPIEITGTDIDWSASGNFTDTIGANTTYTFSNTTDGQTIRALIKASGAYSVTWPANVYGAPSQTASASDLYQITRFGVFFVCTRLSANLAIDTAPPVVTDVDINVDGDELTVTFDKDVTVADGAGFTLTMSGGAVTVSSSPTGTGTSALAFALTGRTVASGETGTLDYDGAGGIVGEINGVAVADFTGETVDNASTYSQYLISEDFTSGTQPASCTSATGVIDWDNPTAFSGMDCVEYDGALKFDLGAEYNEVWFFFHGDFEASTGQQLKLLNASSVAQAAFEFRWDRINTAHGAASGGSGTGTGNGIMSSQSVHWIEYTAETVPGSSANGRLTLYKNHNDISETRGSPKAGAITNGTGDGIRYILFDSPSAGSHFLGKLRASTAVIGSNPV